MIVTIDITDKDAVEKICTKCDYPFRFLTNENNPLILQVEVEFSRGVDLPARYAFMLGREIQMERFERMMNKML